MAPRMIASWRSRAACICSGWCSHRVVLPSISVNRNVMVPDGKALILMASYQTLCQVVAQTLAEQLLQAPVEREDGIQVVFPRRGHAGQHVRADVGVVAGTFKYAG